MRRMVFAAAVASLTACGADRWEGFVYPDRSNLSKHIAIGEYESLEACRVAAQNALGGMNALQRGDWECGLNCKADPSLGGIKVCKETSR